MRFQYMRFIIFSIIHTSGMENCSQHQEAFMQKVETTVAICMLHQKYWYILAKIIISSFLPHQSFELTGFSSTLNELL